MSEGANGSELLLGVDLGSSSEKGVLARPDGEVVATAEREHEMSMPKPGWAEHDAEGVWWKDFAEICSELLEQADGPMAAVSVSGFKPPSASGSPGSEGLVVLPYFAGERMPISDPNARGMICGLTLSHGRGHLYRAMREAGGRAERLVAVGDGTKGGLCTQIVSDVIGERQELPEQTIGASYGDALLAGIASGLVEADADWSSTSDVVEPDPEKRELYDELYAVYKDLYPATRSMAHTLADVQTRSGVS